MVIDLQGILGVVGSLVAMGILVYIGVVGFKQNSKRHGKGGGSGKSSDSSK